MARASLLHAVLDTAAAGSRGLVSNNFYIGKRRAKRPVRCIDVALIARQEARL